MITRVDGITRPSGSTGKCHLSCSSRAIVQEKSPNLCPDCPRDRDCVASELGRFDDSIDHTIFERLLGREKVVAIEIEAHLHDGGTKGRESPSANSQVESNG
eukprot:scaffold2771_cov31-Tisochrysis_lutea.AAC.1